MRPDKNSIDYSIYVITDPFRSRGRSSERIIQMAVAGGATIVQYRDKRGLSTRSMIEEAAAILNITRTAGLPLIINDRLDIALAMDAEGIHLGQEDLPIPTARKYLNDEKIIGVSVRSVEEALQAISEGADYLAVSGVFPSTTKLDVGKPLGVERIKQICSVSTIPVVGIGGISVANAGTVIQSGGSGVAVISSVTSAVDPAAAVRSLKLAIRSARVTR
ncbi:thiamine phosphate synthase [bacterium]|nr:thiamine phosphate synthase [candidate division CSSED10-310 bacterium]